MADIELVIKIPESRYRLLQKQAKTNLGKEKIDEFAEAVLNGTPLPKGHGRLKDFDKIEWYGCDFGRGCIEPKGICSVCNHANCHAKQVRELPTIIEADKESEGEE